LTEILSDTSDGALSRIAQAIDELQADDRNEDEVTRKRLERIVRLLNITCASDEAANGQEGTEEAAESDFADAQENEWLTSPETLQELSTQAENKEFIEGYLKHGRSPEIRALDLKIFLAAVSEEDKDASAQVVQADPRRQALALIMRADDMLRFELAAQEDALASQLESRLSELFGEMQAIEGNLREIMSAASGHSDHKDALLYVSNHLLGARLRLQSAIVRRSASELARREAARAAAGARNASANLEPAKNKTKGHSPQRTRRLLVAAVVIIAVASLAALLIPRANVEQGLGLDAEVRAVNTAELPGAEMLASARVRRDTLVCVVRGLWKHLPEEDKRREIESLSRYGQERGLKTVILFDEQGMPAGSADKGEITIENNLSAARQ
jgi:hypothetical protein